MKKGIAQYVQPFNMVIGGVIVLNPEYGGRDDRRERHPSGDLFFAMACIASMGL